MSAGSIENPVTADWNALELVVRESSIFFICIISYY